MYECIYVCYLMMECLEVNRKCESRKKGMAGRKREKEREIERERETERERKRKRERDRE